MIDICVCVCPSVWSGEILNEGESAFTLFE